MNISELKVGTVYTFKLNSGEELVAKVATIDENSILVSDPVSISPGPKGLQLMPSLFTADPKENVRLNTNSVSMIGETDPSVTDKYREATTGITVPEKKLVLG